MKSSLSYHRFPAWMRTVSSLLVIVIGMYGMSPPSIGSPIPSTVITSSDVRAADLATVQNMLEQKIVQHRLAELGFTPMEIEQRLEYATDEELHQLANQSDMIMAGAGAGLIVTALVIVLLVLLILRITSTDSHVDQDSMVA